MKTSNALSSKVAVRELVARAVDELGPHQSKQLYVFIGSQTTAVSGQWFTSYLVRVEDGREFIVRLTYGGKGIVRTQTRRSCEPIRVERIIDWTLTDNQVSKATVDGMGDNAEPLQKKSAPHCLPADRVLKRLRYLVPRCHRQEILGDLMQDIPAMRAEGYSEKQLCRYVYLQVFYAVKPWNWVRAGFVAWAVSKISGLSWIVRRTS